MKTAEKEKNEFSPFEKNFMNLCLIFGMSEDEAKTAKRSMKKESQKDFDSVMKSITIGAFQKLKKTGQLVDVDGAPVEMSKVENKKKPGEHFHFITIHHPVYGEIQGFSDADRYQEYQDRFGEMIQFRGKIILTVSSRGELGIKDLSGEFEVQKLF